MFSNLSDHELLNILLVINFVYIGYRILRSSIKILGFLVLFLVFQQILNLFFPFCPLSQKSGQNNIIFSFFVRINIRKSAVFGQENSVDL